jgi:membrane-bound lytic murein transglycosylase D
MKRIAYASYIVVIVGFLVTSSCAHKANSVDSSASKLSPPANQSDEAPQDIASFRVKEFESSSTVTEEFESIPTEVNPLVEKWINYFQGRGRPHMERYLSRSTRYEKLMKKVLRDNGLPEDLFYIALIESGFSAKAASHASAVGYWQFIRGTGKRYGLEISRFVDERRDPVLSTQAAAEYFKGLYSVFGSWYLAMASYNVGENRVKKEVMNNYTRDFWELAKKRRLPTETINYIPKFIAAKLIGKDPAKYGFADVDYMPPIEFDSMTTNQPVNLRVMADKMNYNYEDFKALNPKFKGEVAPMKGSSLVLRVPVGMVEQAKMAAAESSVQKLEYVADAGDTQTYKIRRGDNLSSIARKYRTTVAYLRDLNDLTRGKTLSVGTKIQVPDRTPLRERKDRRTIQASADKSEKTNSAGRTVSNEMESLENGRFYVVQNGDSLFSIAQRYNTTVSELKKINNIRRGRNLRVGLRLKLPEEAKNTLINKRNIHRQQSKFHVVKRGENLTEIAERYKVDLRSLKNKNKIKKESKLFVGSRLLIPEAVARQ